MADILWRFADLAPRRFAAGEVLMEEGRETGKLFVLKSGTIEVRRRGTLIVTITEPGAVLGELSALLERPHSATVTATTAVEAYGVDDGLAFLADHPALALEVAQTLARRLETTTALVDRLKEGARETARDTGFFERLLGFLTGQHGRYGAPQPRPR